MPCLPEVEVANIVLAESITLRQEAQGIHQKMQTRHIRKRGAVGAAKFGKTA
jgi:hypothetical protein